MKLVVMESPYAGDVEANAHYARACMRDCLARGESPSAAHMLWAAAGVLNDADPEERRLGIAAGLEWVRAADYTVVYVDLGISGGMLEGIERAQAEGKAINYRSLNGPVNPQLLRGQLEIARLRRGRRQQ